MLRIDGEGNRFAGRKGALMQRGQRPDTLRAGQIDVIACEGAQVVHVGDLAGDRRAAGRAHHDLLGPDHDPDRVAGVHRSQGAAADDERGTVGQSDLDGAFTTARGADGTFIAEGEISEDWLAARGLSAASAG